MKAKIIGMGVAVIVVVSVVAALFFWTNVFADPYWETETSFGAWQETIIIEFADGTSESLKIIQEGRNKPFTVTYEGKEIKRIGLELSASVSGVGYDGATLKYDQSFGVKRSILTSSDTTLYSGTSTRPDGSTQNIPIDTTAPILTTWVTVSKSDGTGLLDDEPSGTYYADFEPQGQVQYKGYPDGGDYQTVELPKSRSVSIKVVNIPPASIVVTLSSDVISD